MGGPIGLPVAGVAVTPGLLGAGLVLAVVGVGAALGSLPALSTHALAGRGRTSVGCRGPAGVPEKTAYRRRIAAWWTSRSPPLKPRNPHREDAANRREANAQCLSLKAIQGTTVGSDPP